MTLTHAHHVLRTELREAKRKANSQVRTAQKRANQAELDWLNALDGTVEKTLLGYDQHVAVVALEAARWRAKALPDPDSQRSLLDHSYRLRELAIRYGHHPDSEVRRQAEVFVVRSRLMGDLARLARGS